MNGQELKRHERFKQEAQFLRCQNQDLRRNLDTCRPAWYRAPVRIDQLEQQVQTPKVENQTLKQKVKELTLAAAGATGNETGSVPSLSIMDRKP